MEVTVENNNLIAEFIGITNEIETGTGILLLIGSKYHKPDDLKYNSSWDWLMPVVEKIESIGGQQVFINGCSCNILGEKHETIKGYGTKLEATYKAVVQFIKWYNENKQNEKSI